MNVVIIKAIIIKLKLDKQNIVDIKNPVIETQEDEVGVSAV